MKITLFHKDSFFVKNRFTISPKYQKTNPFRTNYVNAEVSLFSIIRKPV